MNGLVGKRMLVYFLMKTVPLDGICGTLATILRNNV